MICSDDNKTRQLLRSNTWCCHHSGYAQTNVQGAKSYHQIYLNYEDGLVADHINHHKFDNRFDNLRIVTQQQNCRNKSMPSNNTSGKMGVYRKMENGMSYWVSRITANDGKRVSRWFNINKLGNDEAYARAVQSRKDLEVLYNYLGE